MQVVTEDEAVIGKLSSFDPKTSEGAEYNVFQGLALDQYDPGPYSGSIPIERIAYWGIPDKFDFTHEGVTYYGCSITDAWYVCKKCEGKADYLCSEDGDKVVCRECNHIEDQPLATTEMTIHYERREVLSE